MAAKITTFPSVWTNHYQFAGPLRQSHPAKSLSAVREDLGKHGTVHCWSPVQLQVLNCK